MENDGASSAPSPWIFDLDDGYLLHHHPVFPSEGSDRVVDFRNPGKGTSESSKRKIESLFCVMRKRSRRHKSDDDIDDDDDDMEEGMIVDNCYCSGSDTELSESSEFDVISEYVLEDEMDLMGELESSKSLPICNFPWFNEDEEALVSSDEVNKENGVSSKEDQVLSASLKEVQYINDPQICSGHSNELCEDALRCSVNTEDPEIPCNSEIFKNDGDKSSATEVRVGDVVNMPISMEEMSSSDELRLWNKDYPIPICVVPPDDGSNIETSSLHQIVSFGNERRLWNRYDDPIPISIVPPEDESSILLENYSLHWIVSFGNEYNVRDEHIGLEISPIPLTKTLEGPSRPWSACGSLAAGRNLPLVGDSSGACSSMDGQLYEDRDAELYQDEVDGEDEICFSEIDAMIRKLNLLPDDSDSCLNREEWNPTHTLLGLEHCERSSKRRAIMSQRAIAVLHCRNSKHFIKKHEVVIGRSSDGVNVDVDLCKYGYRNKISRRQALLKLEHYGSFSLKNLGKGHIYVNGEKLDTGQIVDLTSCSSINIRGIVFMFKINKEALRRFLKKNNNNTRGNNENDTKFEWCE